MKVIFVRHGQTTENVVRRHQPEHTPLSPLGRQQAEMAGERLTEVGVTHAIAGPLVRTLETASLIARQLDVIPSIDYSVKELERPLSLVGLKHQHYQSLVFYVLWYVGLARTGESYAQIRGRVAQAKVNIERLPSDSVVVVVTHAVFMSMFLAHICNPRMFTPIGAVRTFLSLISMKNTQMFEYTVEPGQTLCGWVRVHSELTLPIEGTLGVNDLNLS